MSYKNLHTAIRSAIEAGGFRYLPANEWMNFELEIFPNSLVNNSFTIRFPDDAEDVFEDADAVVVAVEVEFLLDARKDAYLEKLDLCDQLIRSLGDASPDGLDCIESVPVNHKVYAGEHVVITFNQIQFAIRNS
ncbi:MAG: hypothetical protein K9N34_03660 [Candidatus Marinimicrobia bacterium]|nr:hypothetical protein [Candidatus Neomarinimicrobiota bacterium]MCF7839791.1 hypothetical protein [Candidatus Neomarinimicrobiota bacterium]